MNFLVFFQFLVNKFTLLDPDLGGEMNADPDPQLMVFFLLFKSFKLMYCKLIML